MIYDDRKNRIGSWLKDVVLPRYNRPDHLGDAEARAEVGDMVDDLNKSIPIMPTADFDDFLVSTFFRLRRSYTGRAWPPIGVFVKAVSAAAKDSPTTAMGRPAEYNPDDYAIMAARMQTGEAVGQDYLYGPKAKELMARGLVTAEVMGAYRAAVWVRLRYTYGHEEGKRHESRLLAEHDASARPTSQEELDAARSARFRKMPQVAE